MPVIRTATENDLPRILELYLQLAIPPVEDGNLESPVLESHRKAFADISTLSGCEVIVAEEEGKVIGTSTLMIVPNLSHYGKPWIIVENVVVDNKYRRTGAGKHSSRPPQRLLLRCARPLGRRLESRYPIATGV